MAEAEVVGFAGDRLFLMPPATSTGLVPGARVVPLEPSAPIARTRAGARRRSACRSAWDCSAACSTPPAGRSTGSGPLGTRADVPLSRAGRSIRSTASRSTRCSTSACARSTRMLTVGRGQRMGLFAGTGVGKIVLLGMMARYTSADVIVVGLIGERGREVKEFIEDILGEEGLRALGGGRRAGRRAAAAAPAGRGLRDRDRRILPRPGQARAADHGLAHPLRDGAARDRAGRSASRRPPRAIRRRCSPSCRSWSSAPATAPAGGGSITAFYTVLTEGDDQQDPIADAARAILDGHIVLSRALAEAGPLPGDRHRSVDQPRDDRADRR